MLNLSRKIAHLSPLPRAPKFDATAAEARPVRVAVVGVGEMGRRHVRVLAAHVGFEVVGVVDASPRAAAAAARELAVPHLASAADAHAAADVVVVATPIGAHDEGVLAALEASRHVLVEKPICGSFADAERLLALARARGAQLFVGHSERFNPVVRALVARVAPSDVHALDFWREGPPRGARRTDDGVLLNLGVHDIDLVALIAGGPATRRRAEGNESRALLTLQAQGGALARVRVDRGALTRRRAVTLTTATHVYEGDLLTPRLTVTPRRGGRSVDVTLDGCEPLLAQAQALHDALHGRAAAIATGLDGARALAIAERASHLTLGTSKEAAMGSAAPAAALAEKL